jgi:MGT family glycosyltransferase
MKKNNQIHFVFLGIPSRGHTTPTISLVKALIALGCKITYLNTEAFKDLIEQTGAKFVDYNSQSLSNISIPISLMEPHEVTIELQKIFFMSALEILPVISLYHKNEPFDAIIYDQMALWGQIFADKYNLLSFCSNTMFLFSSEDIINQLPKFISNLDTDYNDKFNLLKCTANKLESYKDVLDIQTATKSSYIITYYSPALLTSSYNFDNNKIIYLGNRFDSNYFPSTAKLSSESMIYISLGTVFNEKIDLFKLFIDTFNTTKHQVIISTGNNEAVYQYLKSINISSNIHIYKFVDQLEVLSKASFFITHAGFNSIYEGLYFTVPMLMIPHIPEQYFNALKIRELNAGYLLEEEEIYLSGMFKAITNVKKNWQIYKNSSIRIRESFLNSHDNVVVASKIIDIVKNFDLI